MEYLIGLIVLLFGGLFFYKKKADDASTEAKLAETKGRDKELIMINFIAEMDRKV